MLNQSSPLDAFSAAPQIPQMTDLDDIQIVKEKNKNLKKRGKKQKRKLKKSKKKVRRLKQINSHLEQQLERSHGNLEEIRLRCQAEAQRDCYRTLAVAMSKHLGLEDSVPQITLQPPKVEE